MSKKSDDLEKLVAYVSQQRAVFQNHVEGLIRDIIDDPELHHDLISALNNQTDILRDIRTLRNEQLKEMPLAPAPADSRILSMVANLPDDSHTNTEEILQLIAAEIIHEGIWARILNEKTEFLELMKQAISGEPHASKS